MATARTKPVRVAVVVLLVHAVWIGVYFAVGQGALDFARLGAVHVKFGEYFARKAGKRPPITYDPHYDYPRNRDAPQGIGYDGQYDYYLAVTPADARYYMDAQGYRYARILYPMVARVVAAGQRGLIPYALILVNWLAIGAGTLAVAGWLTRRSCSPWWAAVYGLYPGLLTCLQRDLTEPLAYGLTAGAIYLLDFGGRRRLLWAALLFGVAGLARQSVLVFPVVYALVMLLGAGGGLWERVRARWRPAALLATLSLAPVAAWSAYVISAIGPVSGDYVEPAPFLGLATSTQWGPLRQPPVIVGIIVPALFVGALAVRALLRYPRRPELWALLVNLLLFVVFLGRIVYSGGYTAVARVTTGVVLASLLALPWLREVAPRGLLLRAAPVALALAAFVPLLVYEALP